MLNITEKDLQKEDIECGIIYKATSPNNKLYIGKTFFSLERRKKEHLKLSKKGNSKFSKAIRKYGFENFKWEIIEDNIPEMFLDVKECEYIQIFNSYKNGYNATLGGEGGNTFSGLSEEAKQKRISKFKEKTIGKFHTQETKKILSEKAILRQSDKTKCPAFGKKQSQEHITNRVESWRKTWDKKSEEEKCLPYQNVSQERRNNSSERLKRMWNEGNEKLVNNIINLNSPENLEIKKERFRKENPWSISGVMKRFSCDEVEAKRLISEKNKKAWETRRNKDK